MITDNHLLACRNLIMKITSDKRQVHAYNFDHIKPNVIVFALQILNFVEQIMKKQIEYSKYSKPLCQENHTSPR